MASPLLRGMLYVVAAEGLRYSADRMGRRQLYEVAVIHSAPACPTPPEIVALRPALYGKARTPENSDGCYEFADVIQYSSEPLT